MIPTRFRLAVAASAVVGGLSLAMTAPAMAQNAASNQPATAVNNPATTATTKPADADLPIQAVTLFSSGVGYFEHRGTVDGQAQTQLRFKADQINDLLKSLVLQDLDGGIVEAVNYPSNLPLSRQLGSFQIDLSGDVSLTGILSQLQGASVKLSGSFGDVTGTVVSVDQRQVAEGDTTLTKSYVTLFTGTGMKSVAVDSVENFEIQDEKLQEEMAAALTALARARDKDKKPVTFKFSGDGERDVRLAYVVETPVWKTSYRLILPDAANADSDLQGWAIVENQTDNDWEEVQLSLVSGRPISFEMDLAEPLFVARPTVQMPRYQSLRPKAYDDGIAVAGVEMEEVRPGAVAYNRATAGNGGGGGFGGEGGGAPMAGRARQMQAMDADAAAEPMDMAKSVQSVASASDLGELFSYTVGSVSLPRQSSAMIPVVTDEVKSEKVSVYDPGQLQDHPLNGVLLENTSGKHLLAGPITVYEGGSYAGDSQVLDTPPGEKRLLTYGIDLKVDAQLKRGNTANTIVTGSINRGVLLLKRKYRSQWNYTFDNETGDPRTMIIEHPYDRDYELVDTPKPMEETESARRFKVQAEPGPMTFAVTAERTMDEQVQLVNLNLSALVSYARNGSLPEGVREAFTKAAELQRKVAATEEKIAEIERSRRAIESEQNRIRQNMGSVSAESAYYKRLLTKLDEQESELEGLAESEAEQREALETQQSELREYLSNLTV